MKILLIAGGWSSERDVSLSSAKTLEKALQANGHTVTFFDLLGNFDSLCALAAQHDFAFLNLHGSPGEDGLVQAMLDNIGCPYQGSGPAGSFLALNKAAAKQIFRFNGLPTPDWEFLPAMPDANWQPALPYPLFVKSNTGGSSLHLSRVENHEELLAAVRDILSAGEEVLIEPMVYGKEVTCGVLGNEALPPILIEPVGSEYFDYKSKYQKDCAREICPAPIAPEMTLEIQKLALAVHKALGLKGYSRTDFIIIEETGPVILEVNTLPGMTATSLVPQEAKCIGLDFPALLQKLIDLALEGRK